MKWKHVAMGHKSAPYPGGGTVHVVGTAVYVTHPTISTFDLSGYEAGQYIESATGKPAPNGKKNGAPKQDAKPTKPKAKTPVTNGKNDARKTGKKIGKLIRKAGAAVGGVVEGIKAPIGTAEPRAKTPAKKLSVGTRAKTPAKRTHPAEEIPGSAESRLSHLVGPAPSDGMPGMMAEPRPARARKKAPRATQTCEEFFGWK